MKKILFITLFIFLYHSYSYSQISIEECFVLAKNNYPQIKQADLIEKTKEYNISNANRGYIPSILFSAKASYQSDVTKIPFDVPFYDIPTLSKDQYKISVDISQKIWDGGKIEAEKSKTNAKARLDASSLEVQLYSLKYRVNQLFFSILLIEEQINQNHLYEEDLEITYNIIKQSIKSGVANSKDLDVISLEQIKNKQNRASLYNMQQTYINALEMLIGKKIIDGLLKPDNMEIVDMSINRPELQYFTDKINLLESNKKNITASYMPMFDLFFTAGYGKPGFDMLNDDFQPYYMVGIKMDWPLMGFYTGNNTKKLIDINKKSVELERSAFLLDTNIDIKNQQSKIERIKESISYDEEIVLLRKNIRLSSEIKMQQGTLTVNDYMRDVTAENLAKQSKILHEIELLQAVYDMKNIINK